MGGSRQEAEEGRLCPGDQRGTIWVSLRDLDRFCSRKHHCGSKKREQVGRGRGTSDQAVQRVVWSLLQGSLAVLPRCPRGDLCLAVFCDILIDQRSFLEEMTLELSPRRCVRVAQEKRRDESIPGRGDCVVKSPKVDKSLVCLQIRLVEHNEQEAQGRDAEDGRDQAIQSPVVCDKEVEFILCLLNLLSLSFLTNPVFLFSFFFP